MSEIPTEAWLELVRVIVGAVLGCFAIGCLAIAWKLWRTGLYERLQDQERERRKRSVIVDKNGVWHRAWKRI